MNERRMAAWYAFDHLSDPWYSPTLRTTSVCSTRVSTNYLGSKHRKFAEPVAYGVDLSCAQAEASMYSAARIDAVGCSL